MRTVRRLYFYLITLISLEVVVWGVITLLWYTVLRKPVAGSSYLAVGLALVLVGLPILLLHWRTAQRDAAHDDEEHFTRLRALFLYTARMGALVPAVQNVIALINRPILTLLGQPASQAWIGANDTWQDNLAVIAVNLMVWAYFERVLRGEWKAGWPGSVLPEVRRFSRYLWMLYGLGLSIIGTVQVISFIFLVPEGVNAAITVQLGNALALTLVGVPLWVFTWRVSQSALGEADERFSGLRLGVLYLLSLIGSITTLATGAVVLASLLRWVLKLASIFNQGEVTTLAGFLSENANVLASATVFGVVWAYFGACLQSELAARPDDLQRAELRRPYTYILSGLGNAATFIGAWVLLFTLSDLLIGPTASPAGMRASLAGSLASLAVGLPVWLRCWMAGQAEALPLTDLGDHARRSVVRKVYLYLAVFAMVVTGMVVAGMFLYHILNTLLGNPADHFWLDFSQLGLVLVLTLVWLGYHVTILVGDGKRAQQALSQLHAAFPVLAIFHRADPLAADLSRAVQKLAPRLPFSLHFVEEQPLDEDPTAFRLLVIPAALAVHPPEGWAGFLAGFCGERLALPVNGDGWFWQGTLQGRSSRDLAQDTAQSIRRLAEGQSLRSAGMSAAGKTILYILAGVAALELVAALFSLVASLLGQ